MKKLFTLAITMIALFTSMNVLAADDGYRRTWDFRDGYSQRTLDKLAADTKYWQVQGTGYQNHESAGNQDANPFVMVDGQKELIEEFKGFTFNSSARKAKHIQVMYQNFGGYPKSPCLWFNGTGDGVTFNVPAGENVKFGFCPHGTNNRGFKASGLTDANGASQWTTTDNTQVVEVVLVNNKAEDTQVTLTTVTGGAHLYYVIIGEGDSKDAKVTNIGYLYYEAAGKGFEDLSVVAAFKDNAEVKFTGIKVDDAVPTVESLAEYDVVMLDNSLPVSNTALVDFLKANIQWQPTINLNPSLAQALGYGELTEGASNFVIANDITKGWFKTLKAACDAENIDDGSNLIETEDGSGIWMYGMSGEEDLVPGLNIANGLHAGEKSLAEAIDEEMNTSGTANYIHNSGYNEYVYYAMGNTTTQSSTVVLNEIIYDAASSKSDVQTCKAPVCTPTYKDLRTLVALSCTTGKSKIYYTIDGTDPTVESALYDGTPIEFTTEGMVKAVAISDGYKLSPVSTYEVILKNQAKEPVITVEGGGKNADAVITITSDQDVDIYYNFSGSSAASASSLYTGPITMTHACTITAFAIGKEGVALVQSENASQQIAANMGNIRIDQLAHFTADGWNTLADLTLDGETMTAWASSNYYFTWGKTAVASVIESEDEFEMDGEGNPVMDPEFGTPVPLKTPRTPSVTEYANDADWKIQSAGQVMIFQGNTLTTAIGDFTGYNPENAIALEGNYGTKNAIQFGAVASGDQANAVIVSKNKYAGPLKFLAVIANANGDKNSGEGNTNAKVQFEVSVDGTNWTAVGDVYTSSPIYRNYKKLEANYDGEEEVYVRLKSVSGSGQNVHDIYVFNHGEKSAAAEEEFTGIQDATIAPAAKVLKAVKFIKNNQLYIKTADGIYTVSGAKVK